MSGFENIIYEVERGRARITLNRPEKLNALSQPLQTELNEALWEADNNRAVTARSSRAPAAPSPPARPHRRRLHQPGLARPLTGQRVPRATPRSTTTPAPMDVQRLRMVLFDMHKPSIAQVHGYCSGRRHRRGAAVRHDRRGRGRLLLPAGARSGRAPNNMWLYHVGPQWAKRLTMTGDTVTGKEAQQIGLVMKAVPKEHLENEVEQLADRLAMIDPDLLSASKRIINMGLELMGARAPCSGQRPRTTCAATTPRPRARGASACESMACARRCAPGRQVRRRPRARRRARDSRRRRAASRRRHQHQASK